MQIKLNGKELSIAEHLSLSDLVAAFKYETQSVAIALDGTFIPKEKWSSTALANGVEIEVLSPMQGG